MILEVTLATCYGLAGVASMAWHWNDVCDHVSSKTRYYETEYALGALLLTLCFGLWPAAIVWDVATARRQMYRQRVLDAEAQRRILMLEERKLEAMVAQLERDGVLPP